MTIADLNRSLGRGLALGALLVTVAACTSTNPNDALNGGGTGGSGSAASAGSTADPTSPSFFQNSVGDRVLFEVDQATLTDAARATLDAQAQWLGQNADYAAVIEGHADEQGTREYNLALGARRANAAREYLVSRGVAASRIKVVSYGKERPLEVCSEESCYSKNRRAVTILTGALTG